MKVCMVFRVQSEVKINFTNQSFLSSTDCSWQTFKIEASEAKTGEEKAGYIERQQTTSIYKTHSTMMGDGERHSESNTGWQAALPIGPSELARLVADHLIGSLVRLGGSDLGFGLIMEPNSCSYDPINQNHFYSRFFSSPGPGHHHPLASPLTALWPPAVPYPNPAVLF